MKKSLTKKKLKNNLNNISHYVIFQLILFLTVFLILSLSACQEINTGLETDGTAGDGTLNEVNQTGNGDDAVNGGSSNSKPYSEELEKRIIAELTNTTYTSKRENYLPEAMFSRLPDMPKDFYQVRTMIRLGRLTDLGSLGPEYWQQPEFFPNFEEIGVSLIQNPPEGRWGAQGILVYPGDSVSTIVPGDSLELYFFIKSGYLVETYQGMKLKTVFPKSGQIFSGAELTDGAREVEQDPEITAEYFDVRISPDLFVLEPNFPLYRIDGTRKIKVTITADEDTPEGNYLVAVDVDTVPQETENEWVKKYLNLYTSGGMVKLDRPYYQAFIHIAK